MKADVDKGVQMYESKYEISYKQYKFSIHTYVMIAIRFMYQRNRTSLADLKGEKLITFLFSLDSGESHASTFTRFDRSNFPTSS